METFFNLTSLNGKNGFVVKSDKNDYVNFQAVVFLDINGDGISDAAISSYGNPGAVYIIYGSTKPFNVIFNVTSLDGTNGFIITSHNSSTFSSYAGVPVANVKDINNDGIDDLAIGSPPNNGPSSQPGQVFIIFGSRTWSQKFYVESLNGKNGFLVTGSYYDFLGPAVSSAGDINDDGIGDVLLGSSNAFTACVLFGSTNPFNAVINVDNPYNGFTITSSAQYNAGISVTNLGDVNGDKIPDIAIGAPAFKSGIGGRVFVVYGQNVFPDSILLENLNITTGFYIEAPSYNNAGATVSYLGDVNGDKLNDIGISDFNTYIQEQQQGLTGSSYVVFGSTGFNNSFSLSSLNGHNGFLITQNVTDGGGGAIIQGVGYYNDGSLPDIVIGLPNQQQSEGAPVYVVGGQEVFNSSYALPTLTGLDVEFFTNGASGSSMAGFGDINGDNKQDIILSGGNNECYVIFGT